MDLKNLKQQLVTTIENSDNEILLQNMLEVLTQQPSTVEDKELTHLCMAASEKPLAEAWNKEEDARWESFLKD